MRKYLSLVLAVAITPCCFARVITVDDDGPADFNNIQGAISDANNGDTVLISDGVYMGTGNRNITFQGKAITVKSKNGPENCIIDCLHEGSGFTFENAEDANSVIEGITITAAVWGGIECYASSPTIRDCVITGNRNGHDGGGIACYNWGGLAAPHIINCTITENMARDGAGIYGGAGMISNCRIIANRSGGLGSGGGIYGFEGTIKNCVISGNMVTYAGGGLCDCEYSNVTNSMICFNKATHEGGGIYQLVGTIDARNCIIWGNEADIHSNYDEYFVNTSYSCAESFGIGNIWADPLFAENGSMWPMWEDLAIAHWRFDERAGNIAADSMTAHPDMYPDGVIFNAERVESLIGRGLSFDGTTGYVEVVTYTGTDRLNIGSEYFSITAWVKCNKDNSSITAKGFEDGVWVDAGYELGIYNDKLRLSIAHDPCETVSVTGNTIITDNQWHFVTGIRYNDHLYVYVDGNCDGGPVDVFSWNLENDRYVFIGKQYGGILDEVAVYRTALDQSKLTEFYEKGLAGHSYIYKPNYGDYHLMSEAGRWDPNTLIWVIDAVTSPCIDTGDPNSDWTAELWPHGKRINMGAYGGTVEASMSLSTTGNIADLDNSDAVDCNDLYMASQRWLSEEHLLKEDMSRDGQVDFSDIAILGDNWQWQQ